MVLRALAKWYRRSSVRLSVERPGLSCDYCGKNILDETVGYHPESGEIYHPGECSLDANYLLAEHSEECLPLHITYATIDEAIELCRKGKLKQCCRIFDSAGLENA